MRATDTSDKLQSFIENILIKKGYQLLKTRNSNLPFTWISRFTPGMYVLVGVSTKLVYSVTLYFTTLRNIRIAWLSKLDGKQAQELWMRSIPTLL